jgi:hypothetical protein
MGMDYLPTAIERAFDLARSGEYARVSEITDQLKKEDLSTAQITGPSLIAQLRAICTEAQTKAANP